MATPVRAAVRTPGPALPAQRALGRRGLRERTRAQLRQSIDTAPGRLRAASVVLAVLVLAFGGLTVWQVSSRATAADRVVAHSQPLSQDAAEIYRSLADADTTAASGFLLAGDAPQAVRDRYESDLATAARLLAEAAARTGASSPAQQSVTELNQKLPVYAGLVETARADDRQGLPLGGAYLRYASQQMQETMLPIAQKLVAAESAELDRDYADAGGTPWGAFGLGVVALGALIWCQVLLRRRTNRVFNLGLIGATASVLAALCWLSVGISGASSHLTDSRTHGAVPLRALDEARIEALQSRTAENLDLVARGATDDYSKRWTSVTETLAGKLSADGKSRTPGGTLANATATAPAGARPALALARQQFTGWDAHHAAAAAGNDAGDFDTALKDTVGVAGSDTSDSAFNAMDQQLSRAAVVEQASTRAPAEGVSGSLDALAAGAGALAVLAAVGVVRGIGRRLAEYR